VPAITCEPEVVTIGVLDGELTPEQGAVLLRQNRQKASEYLLTRLQTTMRDPDRRTNPFSLGLTHPSLAISPLTPVHPARLIEPEQRDLVSEDLTSAPGLLLDLTWKVCGLVPTFGVIYTKKLPIVMKFLELKFRDEVHDLSYADLATCAKQSSSWPTQALVRKAQARKLAPIADHLIQNPSDVNRDIAEVKRRISEYSFNPDLNEVLDKVESALAAEGDQFDQAASLKHLRTFFEKLHEQAGLRIRAEKVPLSADATDFTKCQQVIDYLERHDVLTDKMKALGRALYGVLSEEGVHSLKADREYVRFCRNWIAEYALVIFFELEQRLKT